MIKIRKRSNPQAEQPPQPTKKTLCGILRTTSSETPKKPYRSVKFVDDIGKPLVDYRYLPPRDQESQPASDHAHHLHTKTSGKYTHHENQIDTKTLPKWQLIGVKGARKPREQSEMGKIEEKRLERLGISRAPLFGTFETIDSIDLIPDAIIRARVPVPRIPLTEARNSYEQVFEEPPKPSSLNVIDLMAQLKQRGLISDEQKVANVEEQTEMPPQRVSRWNQQQQKLPKINKICKYFINNPGGCSHGDSCRFQHNEEERVQRQLELQQIQLLAISSKNAPKNVGKSWRRSPYHRNRSNEKRRENRQKSRSGSPKTRD